MLSFWEMVCIWAPWHKFVEHRKIGFESHYVRCSCGREYGLHDGVQVILPWSDVKEFYQR